MASTSLSRRSMLSALVAAGGVSRLAPFLPSSVHAAGTPKRIISIFHPMGYLEKSFWPTGNGGSDFQLGETMTALEPWKNKLIFPDGMYMYGGGWMPKEDDNEHGNGMRACFTGSRGPMKVEGVEAGFSTGPSIEQAVADFQYAQVKTRFRALALGVSAGGGGSHSSVFHSKALTPVWAQNSAQATFDSLFKDFTGPTAPVTDPAKPVDNSAALSAERLRKQRQSVLDMVRNDLNRLKSVSGAQDKMKVEAHLESISSLENRLSALTPMPSGPGAGPAAPAGSSTMGCAKPTLRAVNDTVNAIHTQMDLITSAFACDLTRTATLQLGGADGFTALPGYSNQHDTTHSNSAGASSTALDNHKKWDRFYADRWAYLLGKLDSIKEGNGTLLDNTLIVFGSDTSTSQSFESPGAHSFHRFPLWLAGGGNFAFKTGQHIKLPLGPSPRSLFLTTRWTAHQRLLTSVAQAFGMNVDKFGASDIGSGPLPGLTRAT